jgi:tRNA U55 pseudouridine synthase TruB
VTSKEVKKEEIIRKLPEEIILNKDTLKKLKSLHRYTVEKFYQLEKLMNKEKKKELTKESDFKRINNKINYLSQQIESLIEREMVTLWLYRGLKNSLRYPHQQHEFPKIMPVEKNGKVNLILDAEQKWINFGEETLNYLVETFYPWREVSLKQKTIKHTLFKEKRGIVLKI